MTTAFEPYCIESCGRPATHEAPIGICNDGDLITGWVCDNCADDEGKR